MKKTFYFLALTTLVLAGCSQKDDLTGGNTPANPTGTTNTGAKEAIEFSMSDGSNNLVTRAAAAQTGFESETRIIMRLQSDDRHASPQSTLYNRTVAKAAAQITTPFQYSKVTFSSEHGDIRYWDDAYGRYAQLSVYAVAIPGKNSEDLLPLSKLMEGNNTSGTAATTAVKEWGTCSINTIEWGVETSAQTLDKHAEQDLVYSNNIQQDSDKGKGGITRYDFTKTNYVPDFTNVLGTDNNFSDGRMQFCQKDNLTTVTDAPGKFDRGHLVFNHALTRMTIQLVEGDGFNTGVTTDFQFANSTNITVKNVPTSGTLDIKNGSWSSPASTDITKLATLAENYPDANGEYRAQFLPGYTFTDGNNTNVLTFTIDNNVYYVTQDMMFDALTKSGAGLEGQTSPVTMEQGKNYVFKITVNKTKVDNITATLEPWKDVTAADENVYNSYVTLNLRTTSGDACSNFDIWRLPNTDGDNIHTTDANSVELKNWNGDYTDKASTLTQESTVWKTNWFFEDNKTFYHFRTVNAGTTINTTPAKDNFVITSGAVASTDPHWGAPMINGASLKYDETEADDGSGVTKEGYSSSIYKAIGSTENQINITEIHMMSKINVILKTVKGDGAVKLLDISKDSEKDSQVTITRFFNAGTVDMGTGFVRVTGSPNQDQLITSPGQTEDNFYETKPTEDNAAVSKAYTWAVVPQKLKRAETPSSNDDYVGITIKTPDANQYYVISKLSEIKASSVTQNNTEIPDPNQSKDAAIEFWYPGHTYTYTFVISKKGIEDITCTVAKWIDVKAEDQEINLEN